MNPSGNIDMSKLTDFLMKKTMSSSSMKNRSDYETFRDLIRKDEEKNATLGTWLNNLQYTSKNNNFDSVTKTTASQGMSANNIVNNRMRTMSETRNVAANTQFDNNPSTSKFEMHDSQEYNNNSNQVPSLTDICDKCIDKLIRSKSESHFRDNSNYQHDSSELKSSLRVPTAMPANKLMRAKSESHYAGYNTPLNHNQSTSPVPVEVHDSSQFRQSERLPASGPNNRMRSVSEPNYIDQNNYILPKSNQPTQRFDVYNNASEFTNSQRIPVPEQCYNEEDSYNPLTNNQNAHRIEVHNSSVAENSQMAPPASNMTFKNQINTMTEPYYDEDDYNLPANSPSTDSLEVQNAPEPANSQQVAPSDMTLGNEINTMPEPYYDETENYNAPTTSQSTHRFEMRDPPEPANSQRVLDSSVHTVYNSDKDKYIPPSRSQSTHRIAQHNSPESTNSQRIPAADSTTHAVYADKDNYNPPPTLTYVRNDSPESTNLQRASRTFIRNQIPASEPYYGDKANYTAPISNQSSHRIEMHDSPKMTNSLRVPASDMRINQRMPLKSEPRYIEEHDTPEFRNSQRVPVCNNCICDACMYKRMQTTSEPRYVDYNTPMNPNPSNSRFEEHDTTESRNTHRIQPCNICDACIYNRMCTKSQARYINDDYNTQLNHNPSNSRFEAHDPPAFTNSQRCIQNRMPESHYVDKSNYAPPRSNQSTHRFETHDSSEFGNSQGVHNCEMCIRKRMRTKSAPRYINNYAMPIRNQATNEFRNSQNLSTSDMCDRCMDKMMRAKSEGRVGDKFLKSALVHNKNYDMNNRWNPSTTNLPSLTQKRPDAFQMRRFNGALQREYEPTNNKMNNTNNAWRDVFRSNSHPYNVYDESR